LKSFLRNHPEAKGKAGKKVGKKTNKKKAKAANGKKEAKA
jgi:hypothetical protein